MDRIRFKELLTAYLNEDIKEGEKNELFRMVTSSGAERVLEEMMDDDLADGLQGDQQLSSSDTERIISNIMHSEENTLQLVKAAQRRKRYRFMAAAAVLVVVLFSWSYFFATGTVVGDTDDFAAMIPRENIQKFSATSAPIEVKLNDGTCVRLQPNSTLSYAGTSSGDREVYLTGEAFFQVAKDPSRPFLVYYNNIVTRVLGTSFTIKTNSATNNVEVSVRTGRVQVTENARITNEKDKDEALKGVILKPNQKTVYDVAKRNFEITLADSIYSLVDVEDLEEKISFPEATAFHYEEPTKMKDIFKQLEALYGIEIVVTNENIYRCVFTGDIHTQDMMKKMQILCLTIGAEYEINGARILVSGKGCR